METALAVAPAVLVRDVNGTPVPDVDVAFEVISDAGSLTESNPVTNNDGVARVGSWTLGPSPGTNMLTAAVTGLPPVTFTATAFGSAASVALQAGDDQTATVGTAVAVDPAVLVRDANGTPVPDVDVAFEVTSGAGSLTEANPVTNSDGIASVR